ARRTPILRVSAGSPIQERQCTRVGLRRRFEPSRVCRMTRTAKAVRNRTQHTQEISMNWDQIEGKWKELAGGVKEHWGKITDDELTTIGGKRDRLAGVI